MSQSPLPNKPSKDESQKPTVVEWLTERMIYGINSNMATEQSLFKLLKARYPENAYALFSQVRNSTGYNGSRTADAVAFGLWPSRGLEVEGFEMKVSRTDWQKELKSPEKADVICKYCDRWWVVISDEKIVQDGELPATWGLLVQKGDKLVVKKAAPKLEPAALDKGFIASLMRRIQEESVAKAEIQQRLADAFKEGQDLQKKHNTTDAMLASKELEALKKSVRQFEDSSGIEINMWNGGQVGEAVKYVLRNGPDHVTKQLTYLRGQLARTLQDLDRSIADATASVRDLPEDSNKGANSTLTE